MNLQPHPHFQPTMESVQAILDNYALTLQDYRAVTSGIENTTLLLNCVQGAFVLRIYRQLRKSDKHIDQEMQFQKYLRERGVPVPGIIANQQGSLFSRVGVDSANWQAILMEFVEGKHLESYPLHFLEAMATAQAQIHTLSSTFSDHYQGFVLRELRETRFIKQIDIAALQNSKLSDFLERAKRYQVSLNKQLPWGLCHLDYDKDNILADSSGNIAAILDFDDLALAPYAVDLAYALLHIYWHVGVDGVASYLTTYERVRTLSELERQNLERVMLFRYYVLCSHAVLDGATDEASVDKYLEIESDLLQEAFFAQ